MTTALQPYATAIVDDPLFWFINPILYLTSRISERTLVHGSFEINMYITSWHFCHKDRWIILQINIFAISSEEPITVDSTAQVSLSSFYLVGRYTWRVNKRTRSSSMTAHTIPSIPVSRVSCTSHAWQSVLELRKLRKYDKKILRD